MMFQCHSHSWFTTQGISPKMSLHSTIFALVAFCLAAFVLVEAEIASKELLNKQKIVYQLLWHVDQPETVPELYNLGKSYSIEANLGSYKHEDYVNEFLEIYKKGMLPRGEIFSVFYPTLQEQAVALFRVFYYSTDFDTFYKTAAWARIFVNEGLFAYAFSVAVVHHPETQRIRVPAYHEIYPHLYFDNEVVRKAYNAKTFADPTKASSDSIIIQANYSKLRSGEDDIVSYFTDDIALNDIHYYTHLGHPFWMSTEDSELMSERRGEVFFWAYRVQLARYYMERLCNDLGPIEEFDWNYPIPYGSNPSSSYHNGFLIPHREEYSDIPSYNYKWLKALRDYEYRISAAIDMGYVILKNGTFFPLRTPTGIYTLGNLIEGNADSINLDVYGSFDRVSRKVLGFSPEPLSKYKVLPSILQHYGLDQRDPIYWSLSKKIVGYYEQFVSTLPKYTKQQLAFPGVKIESVVVDRVTTFFAHNDYLISGAVKAYNANDKTLIKARQYRLNHKPYTYTITVNSEKKSKGSIRIFLGPKYDIHNEEIDITENWRHFIVLDEWMVDLEVGSNKFTRSSSQARIAVPDEVSGDVFYQKIMGAIEGKETYDIPNSLYGYPERMLIPKGSRDGFPYQFLIFIGPYNGEELYHSKSPVLGKKDLLYVPLGFPMDRPVFSNFTDLSNAYFKDFDVYHTEESEINLTT